MALANVSVARDSDTATNECSHEQQPRFSLAPPFDDLPISGGCMGAMQHICMLEFVSAVTSCHYGGCAAVLRFLMQRALRGSFFSFGRMGPSIFILIERLDCSSGGCFQNLAKHAGFVGSAWRAEDGSYHKTCGESQWGSGSRISSIARAGFLLCSRILLQRHISVKAS